MFYSFLQGHIKILILQYGTNYFKFYFQLINYQFFLEKKFLNKKKKKNQIKSGEMLNIVYFAIMFFYIFLMLVKLKYHISYLA